MIYILLNLFLAIEIDEQNHEDRELIFEVLQKALEKKPVMLEKVDTDYEVSNVQIFIGKFKDEK